MLGRRGFLLLFFYTRKDEQQKLRIKDSSRDDIFTHRFDQHQTHTEIITLDM